MSLFGRKQETKKRCCCGGQCNAKAIEAAEVSKISGASIKILGGGCAKCNQLEANTVEALRALNMDTTIEHVTDYAQIATYGVMTTPALVVDGKVVAYGKVLKPEEIIQVIEKVRGV